MTVEQWLGEDNKLGIDIWKRKYQKNDESFDEWLDRVSAGNESLKQLIIEKKFLFGGRILSNRGITSEKVTYSNCYVISPPEDNIESIYDSRKKLARTYSRGGGCGIDLSKLSPAGAKVSNQAKASSGAVSFMQGYSQTTEEIGQAGRRGALMISLDCTHPDLIEFINIKTKENSVTKANISVRITDAFMQAVIDDTDWELSYTREQTGEVISKTVKAKDVFDLLCENNWNWAEPGILYWDNICKWTMLANTPDFEFAGINPCAEEPLPAGGSCLLGAINLAEFVTSDKTFDFVDFQDTVMSAVEALNEVLDEGLPLHPLQEQRDSVRDWRQIGLGIMGLADMLIKMEIPYGSPESFEVCHKIGFDMVDYAIYKSADLAEDFGSYPKYNPNVLTTDFFISNTISDTKENVKNYGLRNSQLLTIAPTGTISTMLGVSGGVEPIFANSYTRKTESLHSKDVFYKVYTPIVEQYMKTHNITNEDDLPNWFVTSATITPEQRVKMQGVWQDHIDASISSTVNLPYEATVQDVKDIYIEAWKKGLKGITVFREGCKRGGVLSTNTSSKDNEEHEDKPAPTLNRGDIICCSNDLVGKKHKLTTGCGSLHVLAYFDPVNGDMQEVYLSKGSTGGCSNFMTGLSRTLSLLCRAGVDVYTIKDQMDSTGNCPSYAVRSATKHDTSKGSCCPMAIGNALIEMYEEIKEELADDDGGESVLAESTSAVSNENTNTNQYKMNPLCPECGEPLAFEGGCNTCKNCGYSKCG